MSVGPIELLVVFMVFLILGPRRIANLLRSLSRGAYDFVDTLGRDKKNELSEEEERDTEDKPRE
jgi:sec-independent protein translocase protein TatA